MILTPKELDQYLLQNHQTISSETRAEILTFFSEEPGEGQIWSEQDIWEQVRKIINRP